ncbi:hypothetical protein [Methylopila sp. M107]|uniref:hypothetical protein n=1 Tax=Methylopila sp. M107 TaxID=1101190 RepID=UPI0003A00673|nr:hypothetical protein [Methylopila sp. M107]
MAKAGRKRKQNVKRQASGQPSRAGAGDVMRLVVLSQPHRRGLPVEARRDHRAESAVGRLFLTGQITASECEAGERLAARKAAFDRALAAPPGMRSAAGQMVAERLSGEDVSQVDVRLGDAPESEEDRAARALAQWGAAEGLVWGVVQCCKADFALVMCVVIEGRDIDRREDGWGLRLVVLRNVLRALAREWRMDEAEETAGERARRVRVAVDGVEIRRDNRRKFA